MLYEHAFPSFFPAMVRSAPDPALPTRCRQLKQAEDAAVLLQALRQHVLARRAPLFGYGKAAALIGRKNSDGAHLGQVCSRIDVACYHAGLPLLTLHWVRRPDGKVNHDSLVGWRAFAQELIDASAGHAWTAGDLELVQARLHALPQKATAALWAEVEAQGPATIRQQLHRALAGRVRMLQAV
jgi:hypothetical protein